MSALKMVCALLASGLLAGCGFGQPTLVVGTDRAESSAIGRALSDYLESADGRAGNFRVALESRTGTCAEIAQAHSGDADLVAVLSSRSDCDVIVSEQLQEQEKMLVARNFAALDAQGPTTAGFAKSSLQAQRCFVVSQGAAGEVMAEAFVKGAARDELAVSGSAEWSSDLQTQRSIVKSAAETSSDCLVIFGNRQSDLSGFLDEKLAMLGDHGRIRVIVSAKMLEPNTLTLGVSQGIYLTDVRASRERAAAQSVDALRAILDVIARSGGSRESIYRSAPRGISANHVRFLVVRDEEIVEIERRLVPASR
jgi:hypothetical protein